jgi:hypothetical protein
MSRLSVSMMPAQTGSVGPHCLTGCEYVAARPFQGALGTGRSNPLAEVLEYEPRLAASPREECNTVRIDATMIINLGIVSQILMSWLSTYTREEPKKDSSPLSFGN